MGSLNMKRYKLVTANTILHQEKKFFFSMNPDCLEYQRYLEWVAAGNTPDPPDPPRPPDIDEDVAIRDIMRKVRRLTNRLKALLPTLDVDDIL